MSDTLDTATPRPLLVDGRNPTADETITVSDSAILSVGAPDADGVVLVTGTADGAATITVDPGADDTNRTSGSDDITVTTTVEPTPLVVSLG